MIAYTFCPEAARAGDAGLEACADLLVLALFFVLAFGSGLSVWDLFFDGFFFGSTLIGGGSSDAKASENPDGSCMGNKTLFTNHDPQCRVAKFFRILLLLFGVV